MSLIQLLRNSLKTEIHDNIFEAYQMFTRTRNFVLLQLQGIIEARSACLTRYCTNKYPQQNCHLDKNHDSDYYQT